VSPAPRTVPPVEEPVSLTLLRCACCERRWLVAGDRSDDGGRPCPYCDDGTIAVFGVHR
jgi:hypothetical protein